MVHRRGRLALALSSASSSKRATGVRRVQQLASRWHWLYRRYCACVIPLFAPQSGDSCLLRVLALGHLLIVFTSWYDSTKLARIETSCSEIGRIPSPEPMKLRLAHCSIGEPRDYRDFTVLLNSETRLKRAPLDAKSELINAIIERTCSKSSSLGRRPRRAGAGGGAPDAINRRVTVG
ncbi:hypothetical protein EVAR_94565_1 [Eumeta japonica]|uniref:Uncharacterized protein n=1 Tax=Eumeta variegata TaxID=151549 RepID=A0A4C1UUZ7_EUMVA|nr:hypothetical protein EVAR_94565_1 [Eumeta japonica]